MADRERQERFCRRAEIEFGRWRRARARGGAGAGRPRGRGVDVAPLIDPALARRASRRRPRGGDA
jgi:hypothetical protein